MKPKLYIDTSIPSACFDLSKPWRLDFTQKWFVNEADKYSIFISTLIVDEVQELLTESKKNDINNLLKELNPTVLEITNEINELAEIYIEKGAFPPKEKRDALHVAIATMHKMSKLASWDYSHIVSENPIKKVKEINEKYSYNMPEISDLLNL